MIAQVVRRIFIAIPQLWGVLTLVFIGIHLVPGDPVQAMLFGHDASAQDMARLRHELGLDQPLPQQYWTFLVHAVHLDFGRSITSGQPVFQEIWSRFPDTLAVVSLALLFATVGGLILGVLAATQQRTGIDLGITGLSILGISLPEFWLGTMLALFFGVDLGWLPVAGVGGFRYFILPAVTLAAGVGAFYTRLVRAALIDVLGEQYVRTARAKGAGRGRMVVHHALRNALLPLITVLGLTIAGLLGGDVIVENVFALPGVGSLATNAIPARDYPVVEGTTFFYACMLILANLLVDLSYAVLDPRTRQ